MDVEGSSSDRRGSRRRKDEGNSSSSRKQVGRSTGPVDRPQYQKFGRPSRLTVNTQLSVGHPVDRPVDRQAGAGCDCRFGNLFVFKGCSYFLGFVSDCWDLLELSCNQRGC